MTLQQTAPAFVEMAHSIVWASVATVDDAQQPAAEWAARARRLPGVATAELDPLRDEGRAYADALAAADRQARLQNT